MHSDLDNNQSEIEKLIKDTLSSPIILDELAKTLSTIIIKKYEDQLNKLEYNVKQVESQLKESEHLLNNANLRIQHLEQYSRRNSLRIFGIPETKDENTDTMICNLISEKLQISLNPTDLDRTHRIGKISTKDRPIIVKFATYNARARVFNLKRYFKGTNITVKEDLTKYNVNLLKTAAEKYGFKNAWSRDGNIFYKTNNQIRQIKNIDDLL